MIGVVDATSFLSPWNRILYIVHQNPECTVADICEHLGIANGRRCDMAPDEVLKYDSTVTMISRLVKAGAMRYEGDFPRRYTATPGNAYFKPEKVKPKPTRKRRRKNDPEYQRAYMREWARKRREKARAEGKCTNCLAGLPEDWSGRLCPECREVSNESHRRRRTSEKGRAYARSYQKRKRIERPEVVNAKRRNYYWRRKLAGICQMCAAKCTDDSNFCAVHKAKMRLVQKTWWSRKSKKARQVEQKILAPSAP